MSNTVSPEENELRFIVIGRKGHGKSTVANELLGKQTFAVGSTTEEGQLGETTKDGKTIKVVDTPDINGDDWDRKKKSDEVNRWKDLVTPGFHKLLMVVMGDSPYTRENFEIFREVRRYLRGRKNTRKRVLIVFTFCNGHDEVKVGKRMMKEVSRWFYGMYTEACGRYVVYKGKHTRDSLDQVVKDYDPENERGFIEVGGSDDDSENESEEEESPKRLKRKKRKRRRRRLLWHGGEGSKESKKGKGRGLVRRFCCCSSES